MPKRDLPPEKKRARLADAGGLYLEIAPSGSKRWFWKYRVNGKEGCLAIGSYPAVKLPAARQARDDAKAQKAGGADPVKSRQVARAMVADTLGAAERMIEAAVEYSLERKQFGVPIASFQAVKHMCADMAARVEPCKALLWHAAFVVANGMSEGPAMACLAKSHLSDVGRFVARTATEVHGGIGFTDALGLHLWFKRIGVNRQLFGGPEFLRAEAARMQGWTA
ncbi:hypothetical protein GCM10022279_24430 [Comamonas faecalis]|uniref:DUF4102 domain-containing protein n=1 Tax=Comamonas faecalis TaxID=1387849 RepID=A0ABP7RMZ7_9BURK